MSVIDAAKTIDAGRRAAETAAKPNVLFTILFLGAIAACGWLVWRDEVRADAQISVLARMERAISELDGDFRAAGISRVSRRTVNARATESEP